MKAPATVTLPIPVEHVVQAGTEEPARTGVESSSRMLRVGDLARVLNCSERHIWSLLASGRLPPPARLGKSVRWCPSRIANWIAAGCPQRGQVRGGV